MLQTRPHTVTLKSVSNVISLLCISDVHHAQAASNQDLLISDLKRPLPNRLIIGIGDELDSISRADQKRHRLEDLKDRFTHAHVYPRLIDAEVEDYAAILEKYTKPEEWLGHISGNHPLAMTQYGVDPVERLCMLLKHQYLGYSAFVPVTIKLPGNTKVSLMILAHHGFGGINARKEGSGLNSYIDHALRYEGWDIALYGHRHDRWAKLVPRIKPQTSGVREKPAWVRSVDRLVCQCGTYHRTLSHNKYPTYSERFGYPPHPLGALVITLGIDRCRENGLDNCTLKIVGTNV